MPLIAQRAAAVPVVAAIAEFIRPATVPVVLLSDPLFRWRTVVRQERENLRPPSGAGQRAAAAMAAAKERAERATQQRTSVHSLLREQQYHRMASQHTRERQDQPGSRSMHTVYGITERGTE